jgi:RNA polymerase sigma factor FliA
MDAAADSPASRDAPCALVETHLRVARQEAQDVARRVPSHIGRDELLSAAMLGLVQAARSYEPARGVPFEAFARTRVRGALLDELRAVDWASRSVRALSRRVAAVTETLVVELARAPTAVEIASALHRSAEDIEQHRRDVERAALVHLDGLPGGGEELLPAVAEHGPAEAALEHERRVHLRAAVEALPARLRRVVHATFFQETTTAELAVELGVSESRVSQLRTEALRLLREGMDAHLDPEGLPRRPAGARAARRRTRYVEAVARALAVQPAVRCA